MKKLYILFLLGLMPIIGFSTTYTWNGGADNVWSNTSNWGVNGYPGDTNTVADITITNGTNQPTMPLGGVYSYNGITVESGASLTINANVTLVGSLTIKYGANGFLSTSCILTAGDVSTSGNIDVKGKITTTYLTNSGDPQSMIIESSGTVTVNSSWTSSSNDSFVLKSTSNASGGTGSIITKGGITITPGTHPIEIQRYVDGAIGKSAIWQLISSPVDAETSLLFKGHYLDSYEELGGDFIQITSTIQNLAIGEGYVVKWDNSYGVSSGSNPIKFRGAPNTGDMPVALKAYTGPDSESNTYFHLPIGFNLVGNPYPSRLNWDLIYAGNSSVVTPSCYRYIYADGGTSGSWVAYIANDSGVDSNGKVISVGQGFGVVLSKNVNNTLTISNSSRTHELGNGFSKKSSIIKESFNFVASTKGMTDKVNFRVNDNATVNFDERYDAYKFNSFEATPTPFFESADGKRLSISSQPLTETVDLGFNMAVSGDVTFSLSDVEGFKEIILEDMQENTFTDLTKTDYTFNYNEKDAETGRFVLHFNREALSEVEELMGMNIYANGSDVTISSIEELKNVEVSIYSITGKLVYSNSFQTLTNEVINTNLSGVNILKLTSDKGEITSKLILR